MENILLLQKKSLGNTEDYEIEIKNVVPTVNLLGYWSNPPINSLRPFTVTSGHGSYSDDPYCIKMKLSCGYFWEYEHGVSYSYAPYVRVRSNSNKVYPAYSTMYLYVRQLVVGNDTPKDLYVHIGDRKYEVFRRATSKLKDKEFKVPIDSFDGTFALTFCESYTREGKGEEANVWIYSIYLGE